MGDSIRDRDRFRETHGRLWEKSCVRACVDTCRVAGINKERVSERTEHTRRREKRQSERAIETENTRKRDMTERTRDWVVPWLWIFHLHQQQGEKYWDERLQALHLELASMSSAVSSVRVGYFRLKRLPVCKMYLQSLVKCCERERASWRRKHGRWGEEVVRLDHFFQPNLEWFFVPQSRDPKVGKLLVGHDRQYLLQQMQRQVFDMYILPDISGIWHLNKACYIRYASWKAGERFLYPCIFVHMHACSCMIATSLTRASCSC